MTISRRTLLSSGGAFLTAATLSVPTFALAGSGAGKVNVQDISITVVSEGDGAPKPIQIKVPDWKWDYLQLSEIIISSLRKGTGGSGGEDRLTENLTLNFKTMENALRKADKGEGLVEGENIVRAQLKNPKWSITIKIVIKF